MDKGITFDEKKYELIDYENEESKPKNIIFLGNTGNMTFPLVNGIKISVSTYEYKDWGWTRRADA